MPVELRSYRLYGIDMSSEVPLPGAEAAGDRTPQITIVVGDETDAADDQVPPGELVAEFVQGERRLYTAVREGGGYRLRCHSLCDFEIAEGLDRIVCRPMRGIDPEFLPILISGTVLAFVLGLGGTLVLHGSAVEVGGSGIAFVAGSGMGKSTLAAQFCAHGASAVTDDVLALSLGSHATIMGGPSEIRLRQKAAVLAADLGDEASTRQTADARLAVRRNQASQDAVPLEAIVCPRPQHDVVELDVVRLGKRDALYELLSWPRVARWCRDDLVVQQLQGVGKVVDLVPVYLAAIPWGPPFSQDLPASLLGAIRA